MMRKQEKAIIWPTYFDSAKTRKQGRRVPKSLAVSNPKIEELQTAAARLGLKNEVVAQVSFPKSPWLKTGSIFVEKKSAKEQIIRNLAKQLIKIRTENQTQN